MKISLEHTIESLFPRSLRWIRLEGVKLSLLQNRPFRLISGELRLLLGYFTLGLNVKNEENTEMTR